MSYWKVIREQEGEFRLPFGVNGVFVIEVKALKDGRRTRLYVGSVGADICEDDHVSKLMWKFERHLKWMKRRQVRFVRWKPSRKKYGGDWMMTEARLTSRFKNKGRWLSIKETRESETADKAAEEARFLAEVKGLEELGDFMQQQRRQIN